MGATEDIADALARDTLEAVERTGDMGLIDDLAKVLEASSSAAHEAYMASIRARAALSRARALLDKRLAAIEAAEAKKANAAPGAAQPGATAKPGGT